MRGATAARASGIRAGKVVLLALVLMITALPEGSLLRPSIAEALPSGFQVNTVISGLDTPTAVAFSPDGRVFVAEKSGLIKVFSNLNDTTPTIFADLSTNVYNFFDRGLLGLELHPNFPGQPYVYALYTFDGDIGGSAPKWGTPGVLSDPCPDPPGATPDGCPAAARLSKLTASGDVMVGPEDVLIEDWCQQGPTHSIGTVAFGPDGALYASAGDGAGPLDWGQYGDPVDNPCGDPPGGVGGVMMPPTAQGGALRSQDVRTASDPTGLHGTVIRIDPEHRGRAADQPDVREQRPEHPKDRRLRAPQPVPFRVPARIVRDLDRGRGRAELGGDQPDLEPDRRGGRELRLALLRGSRSPARLGRSRLHDLRGVVQRASGHGGRPPRLLLPARPAGLRRRHVSGRQRRGQRHRVLRRRELPGLVQRGPVLRRLRPKLHLGDAGEPERCARSIPDPTVPAERRLPGRVRDRPRRRPLLRRHRSRQDPPDPVLLEQPAADGRDPGGRHLRPGAAHGAVRRDRVVRSRGRPAHLRVGPRRRRGVRRLDGTPALLHLRPADRLRRASAGDRSARRVGHRVHPDQRRQQSADGHHRPAARELRVAGGEQRGLRRTGHGSR